MERRVNFSKNFQREDSRKNSDYYYTRKTADNEILCHGRGRGYSFDSGWNSYKLRINQRCFPTNYIIAVATEERYRRRGWIGILLKHAMRETYKQKRAVYIFDAGSGAICYWYDFRFVYRQRQCEVVGKEKQEGAPEILFAKESDCAKLAEFANNYLKEKQVVAVRDKNYYLTTLQEDRKANMAKLLLQNGKVTSWTRYVYAKGEKYEIREPLFFCEDDLLHAVYQLTGDEIEPVKSQCI